MAVPAIDFRGLGEFSLSMRKLSNTKNIKREVGGAMADLLLEQANLIVPVLTGRLRDSGYKQWFNRTWNVGYATPYAAFQHVRSFNRRPPAENQWLLKAAARNADALSQRARDATESWLGDVLPFSKAVQTQFLIAQTQALLKSPTKLPPTHVIEHIVQQYIELDDIEPGTEPTVHIYRIKDDKH